MIDISHWPKFGGSLILKPSSHAKAASANATVKHFEEVDSVF
jgi:hypothetical protein